jgi:hypothetical protein
MRALLTLMFLLCALGCQGENAAAKRAEERLKKAEAEKAEKKKHSAELDAARQKARDGEPSLGAPWDDAKLLLPGAPCPLGTWALFPGSAPGADAGEIQSNEADRAQWVKALKDDSYMLKLRAPDGVAVAAYDAAKEAVPIDVNASMECTDSAGRVTIAWSKDKVRLLAPMAAVAAGEWATKSGSALTARVVFKLTSGEVAGGKRIAHAEVLGVRVASDGEKTLVVEKKNAPPLPAAAPAPTEPAPTEAE